MARNSELVRQWEILREIDGARTGIPIAKLASMRTSTSARFGATSTRCAGPGSRCSTTRSTARRCGSCARSRSADSRKPASASSRCARCTSAAAAADARRRAVPGRDEARVCEARTRAAGGEPAVPRPLAAVIKAKASGRKKHDERKSREVLARACSTRRSRRRRVDDALSLRVVAADEGLRDRAAARVVRGRRNLPDRLGRGVQRAADLRARTHPDAGVSDDHFEPRALPPEPFANSLGVFSGSPEPFEIEFDARAADYVREREWHRRRKSSSARTALCSAADRLRRPAAPKLDPKLPVCARLL